MENKNSKIDFYNCLVEWSEGDESSLRNFWVWAEDFDDAIEKVLTIARKLEIENPLASYIDFYDIEDLPEDVFSIDDGETFVAQDVQIFPTEECYKLPTGVILSFEDSEFEDTQIQTGFDICKYDDGLNEIEVVVEERDILKIYLDLITVLPEIRVFMIKLQEDWEVEDNEEIFINEQISTVELVKNFIEENKVDTLQSGHITLTTYFDEGQTNINISDHKTLIVMSYDKDAIKKACKTLRKYGLEEKQELICVSRGFHHWHYKPYNALNREDLINKLQKQEFSKWESDESSRN